MGSRAARASGRAEPERACCGRRDGEQKDYRGSSHATETENGKTGPDSQRISWERGRRGRERRERGGVDQAESDEGKADAPDRDAAARIPAHDRDPDHFVEASRKRDAHDRGAAAGSSERERARTLVCPEEAAPPVRLEAICDREEEARCGDKGGIPVREGPA